MKKEAIIRLTRTMLEKSIIDANKTVRDFAKDLGYDYEAAEFGSNFKQKCLYFTRNFEVIKEDSKWDFEVSQITFYRAKTRGDKRVSIKGLNKNCKAGDVLTISWHDLFGVVIDISSDRKEEI